MFVFLILFFLSTTVGLGALAHHYKRDLELSALVIQHQQNTLSRMANNDDDVLNYLEAASTVSPLGQRLLGVAKEHCVPALPPAEPKWTHSTEVAPPPEERWQLFLKDLSRESEESYKLQVLDHWVNTVEENFTMAEQDIVLDLLQNPDSRCIARHIFSGTKLSDLIAEAKLT